MKKFLAMLLVFTMLLCLVACGGESEDASNDTNESSQDSSADNSDASGDVSEPADTDDGSSEAPKADGFTVTVVDQDGNPVAGVMVQVCLDDSCLPTVTNADGVATFNVEIVSGHELSVTMCPAGYTYTGEEHIALETGATEYTLELVKGN